MTIAYVGEAHGSGTTASVAVSVPTGVADDDLLVACFLWNYTANNTTLETVSVPSGWDRLIDIEGPEIAAGFTAMFGICTKRASGESGSYSFSTTGTARKAVSISAWRGDVLAEILAADATTYAASIGTTLTAPSLSGIDGGASLYFGGVDTGTAGTLSPPAGYTEIWDSAGGASVPPFEFAYKLLSAGGLLSPAATLSSNFAFARAVGHVVVRDKPLPAGNLFFGAMP